jgi:hypothetical protein
LAGFLPEIFTGFQGYYLPEGVDSVDPGVYSTAIDIKSPPKEGAARETAAAGISQKKGQAGGQPPARNPDQSTEEELPPRANRRRRRKAETGSGTRSAGAIPCESARGDRPGGTARRVIRTFRKRREENAMTRLEMIVRFTDGTGRILHAVEDSVENRRTLDRMAPRLLALPNVESIEVAVRTGRTAGYERSR